MASSELLNNLHDIHTPPPVSWWPLAPGWWIAAALVVLLGVLTWWWWQSRATPWRKQALRELQQLESVLKAEPALAIASVSVIVRRVALTVRDPVTVAALTGDDWLAFLDDAANMQEFSHGAGRALASAPYARAESVDVAALLQLARRWVGRVELKK